MTQPDEDDLMLRLDQLSSDEMFTVERILDEALIDAEDHLKWLDTEEGRRDENTREATKERIALLRRVLGGT